MRKAIDDFYADKQRYPDDLHELVAETTFARSPSTRSPKTAATGYGSGGDHRPTIPADPEPAEPTDRLIR